VQVHEVGVDAQLWRQVQQLVVCQPQLRERRDAAHDGRQHRHAVLVDGQRGEASEVHQEHGQILDSVSVQIDVRQVRQVREVVGQLCYGVAC
jgi:hypothetical protein